MQLAIFVDFGASRIKSALVDIVGGRVVAVAQVLSPSGKSHAEDEHKYEIPAEAYWHALEKVVSELLIDSNFEQEVQGIWLCSEMHGFVLADELGQPLTPYISWKDERAVFDDVGGGASTLQMLKDKLPNYRQITGMNLKSGLPVVTLASILRSRENEEMLANRQEAKVSVLTLVDWLMLRGGEKQPRADITLQMGLGFHEYKTGLLSREIWDVIDGGKFISNFLKVKKKQDDPLGTIKICDRQFRMYAGVGDFQTAIFGAGYLNEGCAIINLGTGSQVAVPYNPSTRLSSELRVLVDGSVAEVITHIPCGRALNVLANFFDQFCPDNSESIFWKAWSRVKAVDIESSRLDTSLCFFETAWGKQPEHSSGWIGVAEGRTDYEAVIAGIAKAWIRQYCQALNLLDPEYKLKHVIVSGGVAQKSAFLLDAFKIFDKERSYMLAKSKTGEETMDGLLKLSERK